jgi:leader peptidase (prepilin peptidase)/N-methyltransferase
MVFLLAALGLLVGALVNQLGSDLPARRGLTRPGCRYCSRIRPYWQWVSLPSFLVWRARCPACGAPIGIRRPLVEIGLAATYGYLWLTIGPSVKLLFFLLYAALLALVLITDIERRLILDLVTYPGMALAVLASIVRPDMTLASALWGGAAGYLFFLAAYAVGNKVFGRGALGYGDIKLAAFVGLATGFPLIVIALFLTIVIGAGITLLLLLTRVRHLGDHVPYGPFLVAGAAVALLWGYPLWDLALGR